jgi:hypothetical protein
MRRIIVLCLLLAGACGAAQSRPQLPPLTVEQAHAFDNGVDFIASLEGLEGRWRDEFDHDLTLRVAAADRIALITVRTLRTDTDPQQRVSYRLQSKVDRDLVGEGEGEIELAALPEQPGFRSIDDNPTRLTDKQYVAYLREGPSGTRWHLSVASPPVLLETERKITDLQRSSKKDEGVRVIVHTN